MVTPPPAPARSWPTVTVFVPVYNQAAFVAQTLDSIVATKYPALELIVVDDASRDASPAVVGAWIRAHPEARVTFVAHAANRGLTATLNEGVARATGEFFTPLAGDDLLLPGGITDRVRHLEERPDKLAVFADCHVIDEAGRRIHESAIEDRCRAYGMRKRALTSDEAVARAIVNHWAVPGPVFLCRLTAFREVGGYDENLRVAEDWDMYLRLAAARKLAFLDGYVAEYRLHATNAIRTRARAIHEDRVRTARKNAHLFSGDEAESLRDFVRRDELDRRLGLGTVRRAFNWARRTLAAARRTRF